MFMHDRSAPPTFLLVHYPVLSRCRGDISKVDKKGYTPLHVAAAYGNFEALQVLVGRRANLWALDNRGFHPAKVAAANRKYESCRFLDNTSIHLQTQYPDHVRSLQNKSLKELEKRLKGIEKGGNSKKYSYATVPAKRRSSDTNVTRKQRGVTQEEMARQNFVLQSPAEDTDNPSREVRFSSPHTVSGKSALRPLLRGHSGAILNTLTDLAIKQPLHRADMEMGSTSSDPLHTRRPQHRAVATMIPLSTADGEPSFLTENDSTLATFLHSLDLLETIAILHREEMDMDSLMLCEESDLQGIGLALGPRKKILSGIEDRKQALSKPGQLKDSEV